jgi:prepilin-type processing-associated H-X9-DG protein
MLGFDGANFTDRRPRLRPLTIRKLMTLVLQASLLLAFFVVVVPSITFFPRTHRNHPQNQCISNIRQLGLGIFGYTNLEGRLPPGTIPNDDLPLDRRLGWGVTILPYIDEVAYLPDRGKTPSEAATLAWDDPVFADLASQRPGITHCWSCPTRASYIAIAGLGTDAPSLPTTHKRAGIFGDSRIVTPADVKDGSATTMMLVESDSVPGPWFAGGRKTVRGLDPTRQPYIGPSRQFGGNHVGGAVVLFADGSAKFVSDSVDPKIFEALSTMAGGEKVSAGWDD